jgi:phospholipid transport system substrate-binding protein
MLVASGLSAALETPKAMVQAQIGQTLTILHDQQMPLAERRRKLRALAEHDLDLPFMARESLGSHWNEISPAQRQEFVGLFTAFIEDAYLTQIQEYAQLNIAVGDARLAPPSYAQVDATVSQPHEDILPITFLMEQHGDGWLVYDVLADGVSMVRNYRAQFDREIKDHGMAALLDSLREKQEQLESLTGQKST